MNQIHFESWELYKSDDYVVINKPPFIATLDDRTTEVNVLALAREKYPDAQVCHRLDKDTSGTLAIARNPEAYRNLAMQFEHREVTKVYHAVVDGRHQFDQLEVDARLLKQNDGTVKIARTGKDALTVFTTLEMYTQHSLIDCRPVTGRMHQIRVHLMSLGAPITGDLTYGGREFLVSSIKRRFRMKKNEEEKPLIKRMALHAFSLQFKGLDGKVVSVESPYPKDISALVRQLRLHAS